MTRTVTLDSAQEVREALDPHIQRQSPLTLPKHKPKATWVQPVMDAGADPTLRALAGMHVQKSFGHVPRIAADAVITIV